MVKLCLFSSLGCEWLEYSTTQFSLAVSEIWIESNDFQKSTRILFKLIFYLVSIRLTKLIFFLPQIGQIITPSVSMALARRELSSGDVSWYTDS